ncbi:MAG: Replicative DNA helicase [Bryobacteraceae bacterium]|nr:Replicative DNA helicase [Bryobacteraceae bacterium]MCC6344353.1 replicative DNA helicase [Bryobacterales bacterium]
MPSGDAIFEKGLPANTDAERFVLGSILVDDEAFLQVAGILEPEDFSLEKHRRIFLRMIDLHDRGERLDRVTLANELMKHGQLESVDGLPYLISLDDGIPQISNLQSYVRIVRNKALLRRIILQSQRTMDQCLAGNEDPENILARAGDELMKLGANRQGAGLSTPQQIIEGYDGGLNAFLDPSKRIQGISTGFLKYDEKTGGMRPGELIIIAARPAMGKTALALNIAHHVAAKAQKPVALFSLEMSKESLLTRLLCAAARVDSQKFRAGFLNQSERRQLQMAAAELVEAPLFIDDTASTNIMDIHAKVKRLKAEHGLGLVVLDYLQLMSSRGRFDNRVQEVSSYSRGLKLMAKELEVPVIALSQLSRAPDTRQGDHRPQLSDLRESGSIEQDADVVNFIFREEVYKPDRTDLKGLAELIIAKQRSGPTGKVNLVFLHSLTKFENRIGDVDDEVPPE